jgi:hypothetical protein
MCLIAEVLVNAKRLLIPAVLVCAGGCASGGGSGESRPASDANRPPPATQAQQSPCGTINGQPVQCVPNQRKAIDDAMAEAERYIQQLPQSFWETYYGYTPYWFNESLSASAAAKPASSFEQARYEYHSFGVWNEQVGASGRILAGSHGQATPASAVPSSGSAKFTGQVLGVYVSPAGTGSSARADLSVDANFTTRTLGFSSSNTTVQGVGNPHLNLSGTLTYVQGQSQFAGSVSNATGTLVGTSKGQFYGPQAQELGGAFSVKSSTTSEMLTGAYGAKRQ